MTRRNAGFVYPALSICIAVVALGVVGLERSSAGCAFCANPSTITAGTSTQLLTLIPNPTTTDWWGLYASSGAADGAFIAWRYTESTNSASTTPFVVPADTAPGSTYEFRVFSNNGFTRLGTTGAITIQAPSTTLSAEQASVAAGHSQSFGWSAIPAPTTKDWIGLYPSSGAADGAFIAWRYTDSTFSAANEDVAVPANAAAGTTYEARLFSDNSLNRLATSAQFAVTPLQNR